MRAYDDLTQGDGTRPALRSRDALAELRAAERHGHDAQVVDALERVVGRVKPTTDASAPIAATSSGTAEVGTSPPRAVPERVGDLVS